ncbi:hypothetical protein BH11CYA1_BH11CYA1_42620 [soil metagenome]
MTDVLNGWQKLDKTVGCMKEGDVKCVSETLKTVEDQKLFMDLLGNKAMSAGLPGLEIVDADKNGHTDAVKVTLGNHKMTVSLTGDKMSVSDDSPTLVKTLGKAADYVEERLNAGVKVVKDAVNSSAPAEDISRANKSNSNSNQLWNDQIRKAGG